MNSPSTWKSYPELKVVIIGDSGGGKTSVVLRFCKGSFSQACTSTIGASFIKQLITTKEGDEMELQIWDTAGQERFQALGPMYYRGAKVAIIVFDITKKDALAAISVWHKALHQENKLEKVVVLVGNKTDLGAERKISREEAEECASELGLSYFETSAKNGEGIPELFESITENAIQKKLQKIDTVASMVEYSPTAKNSTQGGCC